MQFICNYLPVRLCHTGKPKHCYRVTQMVRIMKLLAILLTVAFLQVRADGYTQATVTFSGKDVALEKVISAIKQQTGYTFFYTMDIWKDAKPVTINVRNATVVQVLNLVMEQQPFSYIIEDKTIIISKKKEQQLEVQKSNEVPPIDVRGRVVNESGEPVQAASVSVKGTNRGTTTNDNGEFFMPGLDDNSVLIISGVNINTTEIEINRKSDLGLVKVRMKVAESEEIVVAYNKISRRSNTSSISVVKGDDVSQLPNRSFERQLQGQVPGLLISSGNGEPGGGTANIIIRGIGTGGRSGTFSLARQPLIIIDGVPVSTENFQSVGLASNTTPVTNPLAQLNPSDIETYSVLKDAAAIALYGSRASNGVILITTKTGKPGRPVFNFHHQTDIAYRLKNVEVLNNDEYMELVRESYKNSNPALWTDAKIDADLRSKFPTYVSANGDSVFYADQNWNKSIYNSSPTTINNEFSASGGAENTRYYFGLGYLSQKGIIKNTGYDRASLRYNFSNNLLKWLSFGLNSTLTYNLQNYGSGGEGATDIFGVPYIASTLTPIRLIDGNYNLLSKSFNLGTFNLANSVAALDYNISRATSYRGNGLSFIEIKPVKNLTLRASVGIDFMLSETQDKIDPRLPVDISTPTGIGQIGESNYRRSRIITTNTLKYDLFIDKHLINFILGQEAQIATGHQSTVVRQGIPLALPYITNPQLATTLVTGYSAPTQKETLNSYFAQANYNYKDRYYLSASVRRDGSSKFSINNLYGNYWAIGGAYILTGEDFMKSTAQTINLLKLRGSVGTSGNAAAVNAATKYYLLTTGGVFNGTPASTLGLSPGNPNIKWEKSLSYDLGLEFSLIKERLSGTVDIYKRDISDLIYTVNLPFTSGYTSVQDNIGKMRNKGIEVLVNTKIIDLRNFKWNMSVNWSANQNRLLTANQSLFTNGNLVDSIGQNFDSYYLVRWAGVNPDDGKPQWLDIDGKVTSVYSISEKVIVGKPQPDAYGGITNTFSYKNWQLSILLYYQYGAKIYNQAYTYLLRDGATYPYLNQVKEALDRWQKPGDIAKNPRRLLNNTDGGNNASTRYLFDGDFIRLKNIFIAYNLDNKLIRKLKLKALQIYLQGYNLALWTKYPGFDPENTSETGINYFAYPQSATISLGLDVKF
jgi:TonB-linked SusC/RagA family outer membrane protein